MRGKEGRSCFVFAGFVSQSPLAFLSRVSCFTVKSRNQSPRTRRRLPRLSRCIFNTPSRVRISISAASRRRNAISQRAPQNYLFEERTRRKRIITTRWIWLGQFYQARQVSLRYSFYSYFIVVERARIGFINVRLQNLNLVKNNAVPSDGTSVLYSPCSWVDKQQNVYRTLENCFI